LPCGMHELCVVVSIFVGADMRTRLMYFITTQILAEQLATVRVQLNDESRAKAAAEVRMRIDVCA
jgi:hypothetical protein